MFKSKDQGAMKNFRFCWLAFILSIVSSTAFSENNFQSVSLSGTVFANNETSLSYQTGGCIAEVSSESLATGKTSQGQILVELDDRNAVLALKTAQARLLDLEASVDDSDFAIEVAKADVGRVEEEFQFVEREFDRTKVLFKDNAILATPNSSKAIYCENYDPYVIRVSLSPCGLENDGVCIGLECGFPEFSTLDNNSNGALNLTEFVLGLKEFDDRYSYDYWINVFEYLTGFEQPGAANESLYKIMDFGEFDRICFGLECSIPQFTELDSNADGMLDRDEFVNGLSEAEYKATKKAEANQKAQNKLKYPKGKAFVNVKDYLLDLAAKQKFKGDSYTSTGHAYVKTKYDWSGAKKDGSVRYNVDPKLNKFVLPAVSNVKHGNGPDALSGTSPSLSLIHI